MSHALPAWGEDDSQEAQKAAYDRYYGLFKTDRYAERAHLACQLFTVPGSYGLDQYMNGGGCCMSAILVAHLNCMLDFSCLPHLYQLCHKRWDGNISSSLPDNMVHISYYLAFGTVENWMNYTLNSSFEPDQVLLRECLKWCDICTDFNVSYQVQHCYRVLCYIALGMFVQAEMELQARTSTNTTYHVFPAAYFHIMMCNMAQAQEELHRNREIYLNTTFNQVTHMWMDRYRID